MLNIRKFERAIQRNTNVIQEVHDPFSIVRSMTDDLSKHTSEIKNSYQVRYNQNRKHSTAGEYSNELVEDIMPKKKINQSQLPMYKKLKKVKVSTRKIVRWIRPPRSGNLTKLIPSSSDDDLKREDSVALGNDLPQ